jgi:uncharacterized protein
MHHVSGMMMRLAPSGNVLSGVALLLHNTGNQNGRILDEYLTTVRTLRDGKIARLDTYISDIEMVNTYFA